MLPGTILTIFSSKNNDTHTVLTSNMHYIPRIKFHSSTKQHRMPNSYLEQKNLPTLLLSTQLNSNCPCGEDQLGM